MSENVAFYLAINIARIFEKMQGSHIAFTYTSLDGRKKEDFYVPPPSSLPRSYFSFTRS